MRSPFFKKLPSCLLGAVIAASTAMSVPVQAVDGAPPGLFELDGNTTATGAPGDDWSLLWNNGANDGGSPFAFTGIVADPAPASIFTQGGSKDVNDVNQWKYTSGSVPDKNDITNAYAAAYNNPADVCLTTAGAPIGCSEPGATGDPIHKAGDLIIYFGLDRFANDGDAFAGFWFFQGEVGLDPNSNNFSGNHVAMTENPLFGQTGQPEFLPGDMFVIVEYPQGANAQPIIKVYQWDPNDVDGDKNWDPDESQNPPTKVSSPLDLVVKQSDAKCDGAGDKLACAITNVTTLPNVPEWPYTPKSGNASDLPLESFFEGGINVTRLLGSTPCFASFLAETRSSSSQTAQLKDFVLDDFPVCGIDVTKDCTARLDETSGDHVDVSFFGTLENTGGSSYIAYLKDTTDPSLNATITDVCIDTGAAGCADDGPVAGLVMANGYAYFPLTGGATVRYEGTYSSTGLPPSFTMSDEVTALAFNDVDDVLAYIANSTANAELVIVDDSDTADCDWNVNADLTVVKNCTLLFVDGDHVTVQITGSVTNSGDAPLSNVVVSDSEFGTLDIGTTTLAVDASADFDVTETVLMGDLTKLYTGPVDGLSTVSLTHNDTVTANGDVLASNGTTVLDTAEHSDDAECSDSFTRGIRVDKACDQVILEPDANGRLVVKVKVTATVTNIGDEDLENIVLTDDPAVVFESYPSTLAGGQSTPASFTVDGYYYPTSEIDLTNLTSLSFTDEATVDATGVLSGGEAQGVPAPSDTDDADCPLCPVPD